MRKTGEEMNLERKFINSILEIKNGIVRNLMADTFEEKFALDIHVQVLRHRSPLQCWEWMRVLSKE